MREPESYSPASLRVDWLQEAQKGLPEGLKLFGFRFTPAAEFQIGWINRSGTDMHGICRHFTFGSGGSMEVTIPLRALEKLEGITAPEDVPLILASGVAHFFCELPGDSYASSEEMAWELLIAPYLLRLLNKDT